MKILLVEDTKDVAELLFEYFEAQCFDMDYAATGKHGLQLAQKNTYDVIILDIMLPGLSGYALCQKLREQNNNIPIVMLTARDTQADIIHGLGIGADDYVVKPFDLDILDARVKAAVRRSLNKTSSDVVHIPKLSLELSTRKLSGDVSNITLSPIQASLLSTLMHNYPKAKSRSELEATAWPDDVPDTDLLRRYIYQLRSVLQVVSGRYCIETVTKFGYKLSDVNDVKS